LATVSDDSALEDVEVALLLEGIYRYYGYDFREYALSSLKRRVRERVRAESVPTISDLKAKVLHDRAAMDRLLLGLSVNVSAMFRDPAFYRAFRAKVVPLLRTYPFVRIWCAGCSTGEEVYSLAILLSEAKLYGRCRIYATDMNDVVLQRARDGIFPLKYMRQYTANYIQAGGSEEFSEYYTASHAHAILRPSLRENVVFAQHNLVSDGPFNEFQVILCRNVMIYFNNALQERVHGLFHDCLVPFGFLVLGNKESLYRSAYEPRYGELDAAQRIYRRIG
jgi:chemotaxis protein methyltransferase CheR